MHGDFTRSTSSSTAAPPPLFEATDSPHPRPGPPTNVTVARVAQGYAISWQAPVHGAVPVEYYHIEYKEDPDDTWSHWGPLRETSFLGMRAVGGSRCVCQRPSLSFLPVFLLPQLVT